MGRHKKIKVPPADLDITLPEVNEENNNSDSESIQSENGNSSDNNGNNNSSDSDLYKSDLAEIDTIIENAGKDKGVEKRGRKSKEEKAKIALTIPGSLFVRMHVMVVANGLSALDVLIAKKNAIPAEMLSMEEKVIMELAPVAELAMKQMKLEENPIAAFYIMFGAGMLSNYMSIKALIKQAKKENPEFNINDLKK